MEDQISGEQRLVSRTQEHPRYGEWYPISGSASFVHLKPGKPERLISLDCEMVECEGGEEQVVRICAVDRNCEVIINKLVRPSKQVVNYRTHVHGIPAADVQNAAFSQSDAREEVKKHLTPQTILVGHTLCHDLQVLKIEHPRIIDVALIYKTRGRHIIGLAGLCEKILGYNFRSASLVHDCVQDACIPMKLVLHELQHPTTVVLSQDEVLNQLFIWKIPNGVTSDDLRKLFPASIQCSVKQVRRKGPFVLGTSVAVFPSENLASQSFNSLFGPARKDFCGRPMKSVSAGFGEVCIRKMEL